MTTDSARQSQVARRVRHSVRHVAPWSAIDSIVLLLSYISVYSVRSLTTPFEIVDSFGFIVSILAITLGWLFVYRVYHFVWSQTSGHSATRIVQAMVMATLSITFLNIIIKPQPLPLSVILLANALALSAMVALRYRRRLITGLHWRWRAVWHQEFPISNELRVLIVGAGESGQTLAVRLSRSRTERYKIIGFVDDDPHKQGLYVEDARVIGTRQDIPSLAKKHNIELIVVAIHNIEGSQFRDILNHCEHTNARIKVVPDTVRMITDNQRVKPLRDVLPEDLIGRSIIERHSAVDLSAVKQKRVLITGAAGSIGSELSRQLATYEPTILVLVDNNESDLHDLSISISTKHPEVDLVPVLADVTQKKNLSQVFEAYTPQVVFHAAAYKHVPMLENYPNQALQTNVGGTLNTVELSHKYKVERFVLISTDKAVNPSSVMGASKRVCEYIIHAYSLLYPKETLFTAVRFGNVLGSRGSVVPTFNHQIDNGGPVTVTHPEMTRYFMSIPEAVNLVIHAACMTTDNEIFLLRMGETVKILDIAERMIRLRGLRPYVDIDIEFTGTRPGEKLHEELHHEQEAPSETLHPSIFKLNGWPVPFEPREVLIRIDDLLKRGLSLDCDPLQTLLNTAVAPSEKTRLNETTSGKTTWNS